MSLRFDEVSLPPLRDFSLSLDDGTIAGLTGPDGSGKSTVLRLAAGRVAPEKGTVEATPPVVLVEIGSQARVEFAAALEAGPKVLLIDHALAVLDASAQVARIRQIHGLRRDGAVILVASHDLPLLERLCDVVVALDGGRIVEQGDPGLVLANYRKRMVERSWGAGGLEIAPSARHGDGRVEIASLEIVGQNGQPAATVRSGEQITVRLKLCFRALVENPVAGILIRSRIGVSVYGTNTELEGVEIGPRRAGETAEVEFSFPCNLCPQEYTLTVASHDPDGSPHDWLEEAILFSVVDDRYTAGVANLKANVRVR